MKNERLNTEVQEFKQNYIQLSQEFKEYQDSSKNDCTTELEKNNIERSKENKELTYYKNLCNMYHYSFLVLFIVCCIFYFVRYNRTNNL